MALIYNILLNQPFVTILAHNPVYTLAGLATGEVRELYQGCLACSVGDVIAYDNTLPRQGYEANNYIYSIINTSQIIFTYESQYSIPPS